MRYLLTGDEFGAAEAYRMRLLQEIVEPGRQLERAIELADKSPPRPRWPFRPRLRTVGP